jgi:dihydropteroate synthase
MGIVNITPDSFSDGGRFLDPEAAVEHALQLVADGADILDVGGESTRPFSDPVDVQEEIRRVMPVVGALCKQTKTPVSIDTSKALVAKYALHAGAEIINDITGLTGDPEMLPLVRETGCGACVMHMRGEPKTMQDAPEYADVVAEVFDYLKSRRDALISAGIEQDRIALDPGIGFGKTTMHNLQLLANAGRFHALGCPVLIGHSRKRFLAGLIEEAESGRPGVVSPERPSGGTEPTDACMHLPHPSPAPLDRNVGTIGVALSLARQRVQILRVHDVAAVRQALVAFAAAGGLA